MCASEPFMCFTPSASVKPSSKLFLALSHAPPPDVMDIATNNPLMMTPRSDAPSAAKAAAFEPEISSTPKYTTSGAKTGSSDGIIISRIAALVRRSTARA
ncbi:hypothetical protein D3C72_2218030 [compost metagenome]